MMFTLKTFEELTTRELHKIYQLRSAVFIVEQACAYQDIDDQDLTALHLFHEEEGQLLAYCRLIPTGDMIKLGRVLVAQSARGQGLGRRLVEEAIKIVDSFPNHSRPDNQTQWLSGLSTLNTHLNSPTQLCGGETTISSPTDYRYLSHSHFPKTPIYAQAQAHLKNFYQSLGFRTTSEVYLEDGIPHIDMIRKGSA